MSLGALSLPAGATLGARQRHLNELVQASVARGQSPPAATAKPAAAPLRRLLEIDIACKLQHADYIIRTLQDDDTLYVARALRAEWLLRPDYRHIINPEHLELALFPKMTAPAINKMKHWLCKNLRDPDRCADFYRYYKEGLFLFAIKFLFKCRDEYILSELPQIMTRVTPQHLKIFTEKCPRAAEIFFHMIWADPTVAAGYLKRRRAYHRSVSSVLKADPELFLDITERNQVHGQLSPGATKHIVIHCRSRFEQKAELYVARLLHMPTLAKHLSAEECEKLLLRLARAEYLSSWFSYECVEPLVKRLRAERRSAFKKRVFVDKDVGALVADWPYSLPDEPPAAADPQPHVLDDDQPQLSTQFEHRRPFTGTRNATPHVKRASRVQTKTKIDRLYDQYRFVRFNQLFYTLCRGFGPAGSVETLRDMLLLLVNKSGGREEDIIKLLQLMERYSNEPAHLRAAVVRSLVTRARAWRLPAEAWASLLRFGHGLGFDGLPAEANCPEGLHAVVLRQLLTENHLSANLRGAFFNTFINYSDYSLTTEERICVVDNFGRILTHAAAESEPQIAANYLALLLEVYKGHKIRIDKTSLVIPAVKALASRDPKAARRLLIQLYERRVARKELFLENLEFREDAASYVNILRHDPSVFSSERFVKLISNDDYQIKRSRKMPHHKRYFDLFLHKLSIYFNDDLVVQLLAAIEACIKVKADVRLARPLAALIGAENMKSYLARIDAAKGDDRAARMAAALRACSHLCRPKLNIDEFQLREIGAKAMATRAIICRSVEVEQYVNRLQSWGRTVKVAILLSQRNGSESTAFAVAARLRPVIALKKAFCYFCRQSGDIDIGIMEIVKPLMLTLDILTIEGAARAKCIDQIVKHIRAVPPEIKSDCISFLLPSLIQSNMKTAMLDILQEFLPLINQDTLEESLKFVLEDDFDNDMLTYPTIFVRYFMLSESQDEQISRYLRIGKPYLSRVGILSNTCPILFRHCLTHILNCLKWNRTFFGTKYESCILLYETIAEWMNPILPVHKYFNYHTELYLTMTYFRAVRQAINDFPEVFSDQERKRNEGVDIVGETFGKCILTKVRELMEDNFTSMVEFYGEAVVRYLNEYFPEGPSKSQLVRAVVKGVLLESVGVESIVGIHILKENSRLFHSDTMEQLKATLSAKDAELIFFLYAELVDTNLKTPIKALMPW